MKTYLYEKEGESIEFSIEDYDVEDTEKKKIKFKGRYKTVNLPVDLFVKKVEISETDGFISRETDFHNRYDLEDYIVNWLNQGKDSNAKEIMSEHLNYVRKNILHDLEMEGV